MKERLTSRERPILMSSPMVQAILAGSKRQTRRVLTPQPVRALEHIERDGLAPGIDIRRPPGWRWRNTFVADECEDSSFAEFVAGHGPYGVAGDRLWVKEKWGLRSHTDETDWFTGSVRGCGAEILDRWKLEFAADYGPNQEACFWRPSIFMPRWASRITLEVTDVRVERLQDISEEDALAEGVVRREVWTPKGNEIIHDSGWSTARDAFRVLWDAINGKRAPWSISPWVWVVSFKRFSVKP